MRLTVLGGGFGLYGYMPALFKSSHFTVMLPIRYQEKISARHDIAHFYNRIEWVNSDEACLEGCQGVIIALPPTQQSIWVKKCLSYSGISHFLLEKPAATTPILASDLINDLKKSGKNFRIAYNFRYTDWGKAILHHAMGVESITWNFQAHHYDKNIKVWKRQHQEGGGALRFYGIHLIAFLAELGYSDVSYSEIKAREDNEAEIWHAKLIGADLPPCTLTVNSHNKDAQFVIKASNGQSYSFLHPFQSIQQQTNLNGMDQRIPFLMESISDLFFNEKNYHPWYGQANLLWNKIEQRTLF